MNTENEQTQSQESKQVATKSGSPLFLIVALGVVLVAAAFAFRLIKQRESLGNPPHDLVAGEQFPPLQAEGWLNGKAPSAESLQGKVLVVDAFGHFCPPCRAAAPEMVELHKTHASEDVIFIALTSRGEPELPLTKKFLEETNINWLTGYGVRDTLTALNCKFIPQVWVVNSQGQVVWDSTKPQGHSLEAAIVKTVNKAKAAKEKE